MSGGSEGKPKTGMEEGEMQKEWRKELEDGAGYK